MKAQIAHIGDELHLGGDVEVGAAVEDENAGIHEVRLALILVGAQVGQVGIGRNQRNAGLREANAFAVEEAEDAAGKIFGIYDGIKAARHVIARIGIDRKSVV